MFAGWEEGQQEEFLDICTGVRGMKFLYDGFFKEILNPEYVPERIMALIEKYPEFRQIYEEGYEICRNTERVMEMFSKELYELDRNTIQYMIDEQQDTIDVQKERIGVQEEEIRAQKETIDAQKEEINRQQEAIDNLYKGTIDILRSLNMSDQEIVGRLCAQYQIEEAEARKYL